MFRNARVGDRVWGVNGGKAREDGTNGFVAKVSCCAIPCPISVMFDNEYGTTYSIEGYCNVGDAAPSLYWSKPHIIAPPEPNRKVKKGIKCWASVNMNNNQVLNTYSDEAQAAIASASATGRVLVVELTGEYEVEE